MSRGKKVSPLSEPVRATVTVPGSKSYTNRALLIAAMTGRKVTLNRPLYSDDTEAMIGCIRSLGLTVTKHNESIEVSGDVRSIPDKIYTLDADLSGTTIRFMAALAAVIPGTQILTGKDGLQKRPIGDLVHALRELGADIEYLRTEGFPPIRVNSSTLKHDTVSIRGDVSSQYLSALLMVAPLIGGDVTIKLTGKLISKPYVDMTIDSMRAFGVKIRRSDNMYSIKGGQNYSGDSYIVEGDASGAAYFFAIATLTKSAITVRNLPAESKQADIRFLDILAPMGSRVERNNDAITVIGTGVKAMETNMQECPDQAMTAAVLAAFAGGKTKLSGVASLRVKETERVKAVEQELAKMGIRTESTKDELIIHGGKPIPAAIDTYGDHRIAMAFAVAGTKLPGITINNPEVVTKTFPGFWETLESLSAQNIVLIGMRGSGKSTVGQLLAATLGREFVDLDRLLEKQTGKSIPALVGKHGWDYFREQESKLAQDVGTCRNAVIATGGGVILRAENVVALKAHGQLILLDTSLDTMVSRLKDKTDRPTLTGVKDLRQELESVLEERRERYLRSADIRVVTDNRSPEEIAHEIIQRVKGEQT